MEKKLLLKNLQNDTYCRIGLSKIHGVGIIAIKPIPKNTNPFYITGRKCISYKTIELTDKEVKILPTVVQKLVNDFIGKENNIYSIPSNGFNSLDISFYLNNSKNNNLDIIETKCKYMEFVTNRDIEIGEELTIDYDDYR